MIKPSTDTHDVIIIGGGPAGATAAAVLAEKGRKVLVLERETFPRYHIGESLIPYCYFTLDRIGMVEKLNQSAFPKKYSVQFVSSDGMASAPFYFFKHMEDHPASQSWQVTRSEFDLMMLNNAREKGADAREGVKVTGLIEEDGRVAGVIADDGTGPVEYRAPMTIDASGRDAMSISRNRWRKPDQELKKIALWTYFKGAMRDPGIDEGTTTVAYVGGKHWFWYIPLADDVVSVGIVGEKDYLFRNAKDPETIFNEEVGNNVWIKEHLAIGERCGEFQFTSDFSYRSEYCARDGLVLIGDAFAFLDPVFSSGVFLALKSGELAGEAVDAALNDGDFSAGRFKEYGEAMCYGIEAMRKLVYTFYDENFSFASVLKKHPHLRADLTDCLIGHVERDYDELFNAVAEFASVPAPLPHGKPMEPSPT